MLIEVVAYSSATRFSLHSQLLVGSLPQGKGSRFPDGNRLADKHTFLRGASVGQTHFRKASKFESLSILPAECIFEPTAPKAQTSTSQ
jgi:hypothetical protein